MLVDYSDSEDDEMHEKDQTTTLPALPSSFLDLYSSTVRTSVQDDPALHAGRTRAVPHVEGNWSVHIYLEWIPDGQGHRSLTAAFDHVRTADTARRVHSLLHNALGVELPLHVSLSRPLILRSAQKDAFLTAIRRAIASEGLRTLTLKPQRLRWHMNEDASRDFLVLQLDSDPQLTALLKLCNGVAEEFDQPLLYAPREPGMEQPDVEADTSSTTSQFHVSIAWALPISARSKSQIELPEHMRQHLTKLRMTIAEVKVRIGQDVSSLPLVKTDVPTTSLFL